MTLALVALALGPHRVGDYYTESDFYGGYAPGALRIQSGHLDASRYGVVGPVYDAVLALVGRLTGGLFAAAQAISIASAAGALLLWYALLRRRSGAPLALAALAFLATNATFLRYGASATTDMLAFALVAAASYMALAARGRAAPLAAGALIAVAALTRYGAIVLLPGALACYLWLAPAPGMPKWRAAGLCAAGFAAIAGPWLVVALRAGVAPGSLLFHDIAYDVYARARGGTWAEYQAHLQPGFRSFADVVLRDPGALLRREAGNLAGHLRDDARVLLGWPVAATAALGLVLLAVDGMWRRPAPLALLGALQFLALVPATYSERYALVLLPFFAALAGAAVVSPRWPKRARLGPLAPGSVLAAVPLALALTASVAAQREVLATVPNEVLPVAQALRAHARPGERVAAVKSHVAWYSGVAYVPLPVASRWADLAAGCARDSVTWLYYSWIEANNRPSFWYLLDPQAHAPGLERIAYERVKPAALYRIGPGFGAAPESLANEAARARAEARVLAVLPPGWGWRGHLSMAIESMERARYPEAFAHAGAVVRERPEEAMGWRLYGDAGARLGQGEAAVTAFERALAIEPGDVRSRVLLGWVLLGLKRTDAAADAWRPALDQVNDRMTLTRMAQVYAFLGDAASERKARMALAALPR